MKRFVLSATLIVLSYCSFGQLLSPTLHIQERDTNYCFTTWQLKEISVLISNRYALGRKVQLQDSLIRSLDTAITSCGRQLQLMDTIAQANYQMYQNQVKLTDALKTDLQATQRKVKKVKRQRLLAIIAAGILGVVAILT